MTAAEILDGLEGAKGCIPFGVCDSAYERLADLADRVRREGVTAAGGDGELIKAHATIERLRADLRECQMVRDGLAAELKGYRGRTHAEGQSQ